MIVRTIAGVVAGVATWFATFYAIGISFGLAWTAYRDAARAMFAGDMSLFTTPMLFLNYVLWLGTGLAAGWVAARVGKNRMASLILTAVTFVYFAVNHFVLVWGQFPDWYNVTVPFVMAGSIFLGGRMVRRQ
jgi:hypothetical protein